MAPLLQLGPEWFTEIYLAGVDPTQPGLYEWHIEGVGYYIGQYTHASRPRLEYGRNVTKILNELPYRKSKPDRFRPIHIQLEKAVKEGRRITLTLLENRVEKFDRNQRERELIVERRSRAEREGLLVLNSR